VNNTRFVLKEKHSLFCLRNFDNIAKHNPVNMWNSIYFTRIWKSKREKINQLFPIYMQATCRELQQIKKKI